MKRKQISKVALIVSLLSRFFLYYLCKL
uniref:Uncharacterized protein n=1 Tax=Anguilla anguilla TaxID=7936 RepID=A0A0E9VBT1_ANGAN